MNTLAERMLPYPAQLVNGACRMTVKERAIRIINELPDERATEALEYLEDLLAPQYTLENAPLDDEPETPEERAAVERAKAGIARGKGIAHEELMRRIRGRRCAGR